MEQFLYQRALKSQLVGPAKPAVECLNPCGSCTVFPGTATFGGLVWVESFLEAIWAKQWPWSSSEPELSAADAGQRVGNVLY